MNQRTLRLGAEIQAVLGEVLARGEVRDARVRDAGLVTVTAVRVSGDLREARVAFTVFGADAERLERVRQGLQSAHAYLQQELARRLRARKTPLLSFQVDRSLDNAFRVETLLREAAREHAEVSPVAGRSPDEPAGNGGAGPGAASEPTPVDE